MDLGEVTEAKETHRPKLLLTLGKALETRMAEDNDKKQEVKEDPSKEDLAAKELSGLSGGMRTTDGLSKTIHLDETVPKLME